MDDLKVKFRTVGQAVNWYNSCNPARQHYTNFFEPESHGGGVVVEDFSGDSPKDIHASIGRAIKRALKCQRPRAIEAWALRNSGDRDRQLHPADIAKRLGCGVRLVFSYLAEIDSDLEHELIRRQLLPEKAQE